MIFDNDVVSVAMGQLYGYGSMRDTAWMMNSQTTANLQALANYSGLMNAYRQSISSLGMANAFPDYQWRQRYHHELYGVPMIWDDCQ